MVSRIGKLEDEGTYHDQHRQHTSSRIDLIYSPYPSTIGCQKEQEELGRHHNGNPDIRKGEDHG